jgi:predicted Zn-ribbon and HTH transcriptional regulator
MNMCARCSYIQAMMYIQVSSRCPLCMMVHGEASCTTNMNNIQSSSYQCPICLEKIIEKEEDFEDTKLKN